MNPPMHGTSGTSTSSRASSTVAVGQKERVNGWSCPWHPLQFTAWFFLLSFGVVYYGVCVAYLPSEWRAAGLIIPGGVYVIHIVYHLLALTIDPADINIHGGISKGKAIFDRSQHRHVIENSHCYICQTDVGPHSKHCSVCNKCVSGFDHHCKWLNNCVGDRNYKLFIGCIGSAFVEGLLVFSVKLYIFISYFQDRDGLRGRVSTVLPNERMMYPLGNILVWGGDKFKVFVPVSDVVFIAFIGTIAVLLLVALALLGHLLGFHMYLACLKMTTYEFIVNARDGSNKRGSDVESNARTPGGTRKAMKNRVKPQERRQSLENDRVELSDREQSVASSHVLHSETTVKIINEVSSKAAARHQTGLDSPEESVQLPSNSVALNALNSPDTAKERESITSEESLKEMCVEQASSGDPRASTAPPNFSPTLRESAGGLDGTSSEEELLPCRQGKNSRKNTTPQNCNVERDFQKVRESERKKSKDAAQSCDNKDCTEVTPRKKRKKKKKLRETARTGEELPPLNVRSSRPLPPLRLQNDNDNLVC